MSNVSNQPTTPDYLTESLRAYWFAPPVALWRAIELRAAAEEQYERPLLDLGCGDGLVGQVLFGTAGYADVGADLWADQLRRAVRSGPDAPHIWSQAVSPQLWGIVWGDGRLN